MIWLLTYTGWDTKGNCLFLPDSDQGSLMWIWILSYVIRQSERGHGPIFFGRVIFLAAGKKVLFWIVFLFSEHRKQEASAGAATRAGRCLTSLEMVLTFWSEIALGPSDSAPNTPYTHYPSGFYQHFSYSNMNSPLPFSIYTRTHTPQMPKCTDEPHLQAAGLATGHAAFIQRGNVKQWDSSYSLSSCFMQLFVRSSAGAAWGRHLLFSFSDLLIPVWEGFFSPLAFFNEVLVAKHCQGLTGCQGEHLDFRVYKGRSFS